MGEHHIRLDWTRGDLPFTYESYSRNHRVRFKERVDVTVSAASPYGGDPGQPDPEDLLVASLASCHMLGFLAICAKKRLTVDAYRDDAVGFLENDGRSWWMAKVILRPHAVFAAPPPAEVLAHIHERAHQACFIAHSVKSQVLVEPVP